MPDLDSPASPPPSPSFEVIEPPKIIPNNPEDLVSAEHVQQLMKLLECPICFEILRPNTKAVALCSNGHLFCYPCGDTVTKSDNDTCPLCRNRDIGIEVNHCLIVNLIGIVSQWVNYSCNHDRCNVQMLGKAILEHEKTCEWKPLVCPKNECKLKLPYKDFFNGNHPCVIPTKGQTESDCRKWKYIINFDDIYNFDTHNEEISPRFLPNLLLPPNDDDENHDKLCISAVKTKASGGILFYLCSLETAEDMSDDIKRKRFSLCVDIRTSVGRIGYSTKVVPSTFGETLNSEKHGVFIWRSSLLNFLKLVTENGCFLCPTNKVPHLHITFKEFNQ